MSHDLSAMKSGSDFEFSHKLIQEHQTSLSQQISDSVICLAKFGAAVVFTIVLDNVHGLHCCSYNTSRTVACFSTSNSHCTHVFFSEV